MVVVSEDDVKFHNSLRENIKSFLARSGQRFDRAGARVLDVAPQDHDGAAPHFPFADVQTLDIDPASGATYVADLCVDNSDKIPSDTFDVVVCTEVLEHTLQPFDAVRELERITRPSGVVLVTTPFNFRIHGPLPDCWRFTEHGLRALFARFEIVELVGLETPGRDLMPIQYSLVAQKRLQDSR